ncbi:C-type lectin domain family 2 member L-like [Oryzias latipes]|uniref:C-type lectin domain family 2 member L-like n=1 Tax=Oryzias latipes TaxID=8090 RepID=UPI0009DA7BEC|nr:C-type lectin domain family 2 member L-like [Oryzias latipes]
MEAIYENAEPKVPVCQISVTNPPASIKSNRRFYLCVITFMVMLSVLLLAGLVILGLLWKKGCPEKWIRFGSSCYFFSGESKTWDEARESCRAIEADLVVINTKEENMTPPLR